MEKQSIKQHLTIDNIEEYIEHRLPEEREFEIEEHIADCDECANSLRAAYAFTFAFSRWTAKAHGEAYQRARIIAALPVVQDPIWKERLHKWLERWAGQAEAAVRVVMNVPGEATRLLTEGVEALVKPQSRLQFAYATAPMRIRGTRIRGTKVPEVINKTIVKAEGAPGVEVSVDESAEKIEIRVRGLASGQAAPLVLLVPDAEGEAPLVSEPKQEGGTDDYVAIFQNVPQGKYTLLFEPME